MALEYKELIAWQKAMDFVVAIYHETARFPNEEMFGLSAQLRRAAVSIPSNIAEGQARKSSTEFRRFIKIANGSRQEVETRILIAERLGFLSNPVCQKLFSQANEIGRILHGLSNSLK